MKGRADEQEKLVTASAGSTKRLLGSRIGRRIVALFVLCAMLPLGILAALALQRVTHELIGEAHNRLHDFAKSAGMTLFERLAVVETDLNSVAAALGDDPTAAAATCARARARLAERLDALIVIECDATGAAAATIGGRCLRLAAGDLAQLADGKTRVLPRPHPQGPATAGTPAAREAARRVVQHDILMLRAVAAMPHRLLCGLIRPEFLWGGDEFQPEDHEVVALGERRELLFSSAAALPVDLAAVTTDAPHGGRLEWQRDGRTRIGAYWRLFSRARLGSSFTLLCSQDSDDVLRSLREFRQSFLLVFLLSFLVVAFASLVQIRRCLGPITEIMRATQRIAAGDRDVRVHVASGDELQDLGDAFNLMSARLLVADGKREKFEAQLIDARNEALVAARTEAEFLQNVSHEMRTPLTSIRSFAEILHDYADEEPQTRREFLQVIVLESERLTHLIENILDLGRLQTDTAAWSFAAIDLVDVVRTAAAAAQPLATAKEIALDVAVPAAPMPTHGDRQRLLQAIGNLIDNAIKFSPLGEKVTVRAGRQAHWLMVEVEDHGRGIDPAHHALIFERFRQVSDNLVTDKPAGTGLGLTIARDIVRRHHGQIEVESEVGTGALFRILLPVRTAAELERESVPPTLAAAAGREPAAAMS